MRDKIRKGVIGAAVLLAALWCAALVSFVTATPTLVTKLPASSEHPSTPHNLVARQYGPVVKASSGSWQALHHPAFVVDERNNPTRVECWETEPADTAPWLELEWDRPRQVSSVWLDYAGGARSPGLPNYTIRCLPEGQPSIDIRGNELARATHELPCANATGVRFELYPDRARGQSVVRLYEVRVMGQ